MNIGHASTNILLQYIQNRVCDSVFLCSWANIRQKISHLVVTLRDNRYFTFLYYSQSSRDCSKVSYKLNGTENPIFQPNLNHPPQNLLLHHGREFFFIVAFHLYF